MLLDLPSALTVNVPKYEEVHAKMTPFGFFIQDEWHIRPNLTINVGLRYDYNPAVALIGASGETVNALDLPAGKFIIGSKQTSAYTTGCDTPQLPPCIPGGLSSANPAFLVNVGGVTYNTLNNISFSSSQPALKSIKDNIGPRVGLAWQFPAEDRLARRLRHILRSHRLPQPVRGEYTARFHLALDSRSLRHAQQRSRRNRRRADHRTHLQQLRHLRPLWRIRHLPAHRPRGKQPDRGRPHALGIDFWRIHQRPRLQRPAILPVEYTNRTPIDRHEHVFRWLCRQHHPTSGLLLQGQLSARWPVLPEQPSRGLHVSDDSLSPRPPSTRRSISPLAAQGWNYSESKGHSNYNSLQAQFQKRFSGGLETLVAFTWSKCLANTNGDFNAENGAIGAPTSTSSVPAWLMVSVPTTSQAVQLERRLSIAVRPRQAMAQSRIASHVLGNWNTNYSFLARSGQAFSPSWGGASNICSTTVTTNCVPVLNRRRCPDQHRSRQSLERRRSHHRIYPPQRPSGPVI